MKKLGILLALALVFALVACGRTRAPASSPPALTEIRIGAPSHPHAEILKALESNFEAQGVKVIIVDYADQDLANAALAAGDIDANYLQDRGALDSFNEKNKTGLVSIASVHYEPLGIYPGKTKTLRALEKGARIAVPDDPDGEGRALRLLQSAELIELKEGVGLNAAVRDITKNPFDLKIAGVEAARLPRSLADADLAVISGSCAVDAGLKVGLDALFIENKRSEGAQTFAHILAVRSEDSNGALFKAAKTLTSDAARSFMEVHFTGAVLPAF